MQNRVSDKEEHARAKEVCPCTRIQKKTKIHLHAIVIVIEDNNKRKKGGVGMQILVYYTHAGATFAILVTFPFHNPDIPSRSTMCRM